MVTDVSAGRSTFFCSSRMTGDNMTKVADCADGEYVQCQEQLKRDLSNYAATYRLVKAGLHAILK